jgi:hypothetical protein
MRSSHLCRRLPRGLSPSNFECSLPSRQSYPCLFDNSSSLTSGEQYRVLQHVALRKINRGNYTHTHIMMGLLPLTSVSRALRHVFRPWSCSSNCSLCGFSLSMADVTTACLQTLHSHCLISARMHISQFHLRYCCINSQICIPSQINRIQP